LIHAAVLCGKRAGSSMRAAGHLIGAEKGLIDGLSRAGDGMLRPGWMRVPVCRRGRKHLRAGTHGGIWFHRGRFLCSLRGVSRLKSIEIIFHKIQWRAGALMRSFRCIRRAKRIIAALDRIWFRVPALARLAHEIGAKLDGVRSCS
jgi:hypothetical protein